MKTARELVFSVEYRIEHHSVLNEEVREVLVRAPDMDTAEQIAEAQIREALREEGAGDAELLFWGASQVGR